MSKSNFGRVVASSIVGGTASALDGGKFANGAITGAYVMLFNHNMHDDSEGESALDKNSVSETKVVTMGDDGDAGTKILLELAVGKGLFNGIKQAFNLLKMMRVAKTGTQALKPLGLGSTGRTAAANLTEQLAMKEAMSNPATGKVVMQGLKDARWSGWNKMQYTHTALDGTKTTIHYVGQFKNGVLTAVDDFKFVFP